MDEQKRVEIKTPETNWSGWNFIRCQPEIAAALDSIQSGVTDYLRDKDGVWYARLHE